MRGETPSLELNRRRGDFGLPALSASTPLIRPAARATFSRKGEGFLLCYEN
jgi:hypothetical protein